MLQDMNGLIHHMTFEELGCFKSNSVVYVIQSLRECGEGQFPKCLKVLHDIAQSGGEVADIIIDIILTIIPQILKPPTTTVTGACDRTLMCCSELKNVIDIRFSSIFSAAHRYHLLAQLCK
jgi:hypothetical protein